jgi:GT2 family glycosyltransferase
MSEIGIILVVYNQASNLKPLYDSLAMQSNRKFRIYFVDNNSSDNSLPLSRELNKAYNFDITYISLNENKGYAEGNNIAAKKASEDGCKYLFILNNDMVLDSLCLEELLKITESDSSVCCTGPLIFYHKLRNPEVIQEYGGKINFKFAEVKKNFANENINNSNLPETLETDFISGGAMMIRTDVFTKIGMFETIYFAYLDEIDLSKRIKSSGSGKMMVTSKAAVWHNHDWNSENKKAYYIEYYLMERNKFLYYYKYKLYLPVIISFTIDVLKFPARLLWFKKVCDYKLGLYYLKGMLDGLLNRKGKPKKLVS